MLSQESMACLTGEETFLGHCHFNELCLCFAYNLSILLQRKTVKKVQKTQTYTKPLGEEGQTSCIRNALLKSDKNKKRQKKY